jgi:hypothetical protein
MTDPVFEGPYEDVPPHLQRPLQEWVNEQFDRYHDLEPELADIVCLRLRYAVDRRTSGMAYLSKTVNMALLDVVDAVLALRTELNHVGDRGGALEFLLSEAGSAYTVAGDGTGLELRVDPTVAASIQAAIDEASAEPSAGSASGHLEVAWRAAYGLHPDSVRAYSEAIKAVECAAHAVIEPNNGRATLGSMLGEIRGGARAKFATAIATKPTGDPMAVVEAMMRALWDGQTSRHGKQTPTQPEPLEAARASVHLAATLVQWFVSGAVTRNP